MKLSLLGSQFVVMVFFLVFLFSCGGSSESSATKNPTEIVPDTTNTAIESTSKKELVFTNKTDELGFNHQWGIVDLPPKEGLVAELYQLAGGMALGDYDQDGDIDVFVTAGNKEKSKLFQKQTDGSFKDVALSAGVQLTGFYSGPSFADIDNDGDVDLFVGGIGKTKSKVFINEGNGHFVEGQAPTISKEYTVSSSFADIDHDGLIDLGLSHYASTLSNDSEHLWKNIDGQYFESINNRDGLVSSSLNGADNRFGVDITFTPSFGDLNNNGDIDLLMITDFTWTSLFFNNIDKDFVDFIENTAQLNIKQNDVNGMGGTLADIDNDGDLDIFITSIIELGTDSGTLSVSGNKLLLNDGTGQFVDHSYQAKIFNGGWAWGSCIADFDNDGLQDIFNTNGWEEASAKSDKYESHDDDSVKLFKNTYTGVFNLLNTTIGLTDKGQGRAVVCFDHDNDGDIDILISNHNIEGNGLLFYENTGVNGNYLKIDLRTADENTFALGARVYVKTLTDGQEQVQMREVNINSNFTSQTPSQLHFGLNDVEVIEQIKIVWPDGDIQLMTDVNANQSLIINQS
jgi:predicted nucleotidyltransferase